MKGRYLEPILVAPGNASSTGTTDPTLVRRPEFDALVDSLGDAAYVDIGVASTEVAVGNHTHAVVAQYAVPDVLTVVTGTLDSGTVTTLAIKDETDVSVSEVTGTPGFIIELEFHNVTHIDLFEFFGRYSGSTTHFVQLQCYSPDPATWENYGTFGSSAVDQWYRFPIVDSDEHIDGSGTVKFRLYHIQSGVSSHDMFIDYARIRTGYLAQSST